MDKFLRYEFFKSRGFATKASGMQFLDQQGLRAVMETYAQQIDEFKEQKVTEFEDIFDKHSEEKKMYLLQEKEQIRAKRDEKKELVKKSMKDQLRQEILQELAVEKELQVRADILSQYSTFIPNVLDINLQELREQFIAISKAVAENKLVLEPEQKAKLTTLSTQTTQMAIALGMIKTDLQNSFNHLLN